MNHEMTAGTWYTHMSDTSNIRSKLIDVKIAIENTIYSWLNYGMYFGIAIVLILFLFFIIYLLITIIKCVSFKKKKSLRNFNSKHRRLRKDFELKPLKARPVDEMFDEIFRSNMSLYSVKKDDI